MKNFGMFDSPNSGRAKPNCSSDNVGKKNISSTTFEILLLGNFATHNDSKLAMNVFLKSASVTPVKNNSCYPIQRENGVSFNLMVLTDKLMHRLLIPKANMIVILPNNVDDFDTCVDIINENESSLSKGIKIFYFNNFPKDSSEYSLIERKASMLNQTSNLNYNLLDESAIKSLLENPEKASLSLEKIKVPNKQKSYENSNSICLIS